MGTDEKLHERQPSIRFAHDIDDGGKEPHTSSIRSATRSPHRYHQQLQKRVPPTCNRLYTAPNTSTSTTYMRGERQCKQRGAAERAFSCCYPAHDP